MSQSVTFPPAASSRGTFDLTDAPLVVLKGAVPPTLGGSVFGLAPTGTGPMTNTPFLNGDPLFYRIDFGGGTARITARRSLDTSGVADTNAPQGGVGWEFKDFGITRLSPRLGAREFSNTALVPVRLPGSQRSVLVATYDAGRPHYLDPMSLELLGPVGTLSEWRANLLMNFPFKQVFSTAHPVFDQGTGEFFAVNHGRSIGGLLDSLISFLQAWIPWANFLPAAPEPVSAWNLFTDTLKHAHARLADALSGVTEEGPFSPDNIERLASFAAGLDHAGKSLGNSAALIEKSMLRSELTRHQQLVDSLIDASTDAAFLPASIFGLLQGKLELLKWMIAFVHLMVEFSADGPIAGERPDEPFTYLLRWKKDGTVQRFELRHQGKPVEVVQSAHQMGLSKEFVVFVDAAFKLEIDGLMSIPDSVPKELIELFRRAVSQPQQTVAKFYFVPRAELDRTDLPSNRHGAFPAKIVEAQSVTLSGEVVHFLVDYQSPKPGTLVLHAIHQNAMDGAEFVLRGDRRWDGGAIPAAVLGNFPASMSTNLFGRYEINVPAQSVSASRLLAQPELTWSLGLSAGRGVSTWGSQGDTLDEVFVYSAGLVPDTLTELIFNLYKGYPGRVAADLEHFLGAGGLPSRLLRVDLRQMKIVESFALEDDQQLVSPQYVPDGTNAGFVVCNVFSGPASVAAGSAEREIWIFAADKIADGPKCRLGHADINWGYTLHAAWLPTLEAPTAADDYIKPDDDLAPWLGQPSPFKTFYDTHVKPKP